MDYGVWKGFGYSLRTELVDAQNPWIIADYGLLQLWVMTALTVDQMALILWRPRSKPPRIMGLLFTLLLLDNIR